MGTPSRQKRQPLDGPVPDATGPAGSHAAALLRRMSLRQKVAQLMMPRVGGAYLPAGAAELARLRSWLGADPIGGIVIGMGPPLEIAARLNVLQELAAVPLLVSADMESGPGRILNGGVILPYGLENGGGTRFPPLMALGAADAEELAYELGRITALEARAVGVHVVFAPVADVNGNPRNPIINTRSYGADAARVARLVAAHVRGLQDHGAIATAKHFPGHGDTSTDSHVALPYSAADEHRLFAHDLVPFRAAIEAGAGGIMTGHIAVPRLTGDGVPATLHPRLVAGLLRSGLGFEGLVFTDALDMGAITHHCATASAAVLALQAGVDVLVQTPADEVPAVIDAVVAAAQQGRLAASRIDEAALRVLAAKVRLGLFDRAVVRLEDVAAVVGIPPHVEHAEDAARRAITVLRDRDRVLPLAGRRVLLIVGTDGCDPLAGTAFAAGLAPHVPQLEVLAVAGAVDRAVPDARLERLAAGAAQADIVLFAAFTRVLPGQDATALDPAVAEAVRRAGAGRSLIVVSFGSPYILAQFPEAGCHALAWAAWEPLQSAAARALTGGAAVAGRLPVPVPPLYELGAGLRLERERHR
jgi:beta-N-acetylhexosaminidase